MAKAEKAIRFGYTPNENMQFRTSESDGKRFIEGYAIVFDQPADMGFFTEYVRPGALNQTLSGKPDVRAFWNHDTNNLIGRTISGTLKLRVDKTGLSFIDEIPNTQAGNDTHELVKRGDVTGCSFGFRTIKDRWYKEPVKLPDGTVAQRDARELLEIQLVEISPVSFDAYKQTSISARSAERQELASHGVDIDKITAALYKAERRGDNEVIQAMMDAIGESIGDGTEDEGTSPSDEETSSAIIPAADDTTATDEQGGDDVSGITVEVMEMQLKLMRLWM
jgi:hypothetical protein